MAKPFSSPFALDVPTLGFPSGSGRCRLDASWGSDTPQHRQILRSQVREALLELGDDTPYSQILALDILPNSDRFGISISHTKGMGGFLIHDFTNGVGLDIEPQDRVSTEALKRVLSPSTANTLFAVLLAHPTMAWTALEASFKALSKGGLAQVIPDIAVLKWESEGPGTARFEAHSIRHPNVPKVLGRTVQQGGFQVSTAFISS